MQKNYSKISHSIFLIPKFSYKHEFIWIKRKHDSKKRNMYMQVPVETRIRHQTPGAVVVS